MDRPYIPPTPSKATVGSAAVADEEAARGFHHMVEEHYKRLRKELEEGQDLILEFHSPAGYVIRINQIGRISDSLIFQGHNQLGELCQALARPASLVVMFRFVTLRAEEPPRPPVGFSLDYPRSYSLGCSH
jgi:hypothetical protein